MLKNSCCTLCLSAYGGNILCEEVTERQRKEHRPAWSSGMTEHVVVVVFFTLCCLLYTNFYEHFFTKTLPEHFPVLSLITTQIVKETVTKSHIETLSTLWGYHVVCTLSYICLNHFNNWPSPHTFSLHALLLHVHEGENEWVGVFAVLLKQGHIGKGSALISILKGLG